MNMVDLAHKLLNPFNVHVPDLTETHPDDEDEEKECECGCGKKEGCCTVDDEVDEALLERE